MSGVFQLLAAMGGVSVPAGTLADLTFVGADGTQDWEDAVVANTWAGNGSPAPVINANRIALPGTNQYLSCTSGTFAFGSGDFTVELLGIQWAVAGNRGLWSTSLTSSPGELALAYDGAQIQLNWNGNENDSPFTPAIGTLYDILVTRVGTALKVFIRLSGGSYTTPHISVTDSSAKTNTTFYLGAYWNNGFCFNGYYARLRILNAGTTP